MDAFDPASPTEMDEEKIACRLDQCYFGLILDRNLQNIAVPIEIISPNLWSDGVDSLPCLAPKLRLIPSTRRKAWDAKVETHHLLGSSQLPHAGKSPPGAFEAAAIAINDPDVAYPLALQAEPDR